MGERNTGFNLETFQSDQCSGDGTQKKDSHSPQQSTRLENAASAALNHTNVTLVEFKAVRGATSWLQLRIKCL